MKGEYLPTIGLEIHAELKTTTKMFCRSKNDPNETRPNANVCPVCLAHPGTLPVVNHEAVRHVLRVGTALRSKLADYTEFDRKNYFYPDLPKGYQISQYEFPLVSGGELAGVKITRVHLEEDTASSMHDENSATTSIDFNRAGVPLMELVTEPTIHSATDAGNFARELQLLLRYLGASEANMEKGEMRVEANVSIGKDGKLGTKVEIKNLNSFRVMERAVAYEIERQTKTLESGQSVVQETRGWDETKQQTFSQRVKEGSADYRYFPDPDIPSMKLSEIPEFGAGELERGLPELPQQRRERYLQLGLRKDDADLFVKDIRFGNFFDRLVKSYASLSSDTVKLAANYLANDMVKVIRDIEERETKICADIPISEQNFNKIIDLTATGKISSRSAKDLLLLTVEEPSDPEIVARDRGLLQTVDMTKVEEVINGILASHESVAADFKSGKSAALEFLVGQGMRELKGSGNPNVLRDLLRKKLS